MSHHTDTDYLALFTALRPRLFSIAYRMLGVRADAEDVLQDAWLRWHANDKTQIQSCEAWLVSVVTRLAIDRLRTSKADRETYVGWWLPEPLVELDENTRKVRWNWPAMCRSPSCGRWRGCPPTNARHS